jgi:hypothetical protein
MIAHNLKRIIHTLGLAVAILGIAGCSTHSESHGPNGVTCQSESHGFLMFVHAEMICTDANGKVISSGSGGTY